METSTTFQGSWTLAEAIIFDIAAHLKNGRNAWLVGSVEKYYWEFEVIVRILWGMLDTKERDKAIEKEKEIIEYLPIDSNEKKKKMCVLMKDYDGMVMDFIHKHKLDMPQKVDRTRMMA